MDEASKLFSQSFQKDREPNSTSGGITAANLIDAIITKQINTDSTKSGSLGNYPSSSLNRLKSSSSSSSSSINNNPSPNNTPTPNNSNTVLNVKNILMEDRALDIGTLFNQHKGPTPIPSATSIIDFSNISGKQTLKDTIFSMITDNIQNSSPSSSSPGSSVVVTSSSRSSKNVRDDLNIVSATSSSGLSTTTASNSLVSDNFKLRRALQPMGTAIDPSVHRQQVIHMAGNVSTTPTSMASNASPLPPNLKHLSHYIEPISPPQGSSSGTQPPNASVTTANWPNFLNYSLPFGYHPAPHLPPSKITNNSESSAHHLPGGHESPFFIKNRIEEEMKRTSSESNCGNYATTSANANEQQEGNRPDKSEMAVDNSNNAGGSSRSSTPSSKKLATEESKKELSQHSTAGHNLENASSTSMDNNNKTTPLSFPDSPSSPGEMVIDENPRPPSPISSPEVQNNSMANESSNDNKNAKSGVIKLNSNSYGNFVYSFLIEK
ncbi:hypothetical protein BLA29_004735 [Euroglyphus maynei]|uniref:Uncharacterized protein n=1 Tax=Euroglyphus maynei TaxID=6958 RepID=A0A1Y3B6F5_EURMA|nr:hypothetical protein BLA29_004735 [Euroglyphus maynei]